MTYNTLSEGTTTIMNTKITALALSISFLFLGACGGSESVTKSDEVVATVEDRGVGADGADVYSAGAEGVQAHGLGSATYSSADLNDPDSPLSVRVIYFEYDSTVVLADYRPAVEAHAAFLSQNPDAVVTLEGHADERGSREYNLALGENRAEALKRQMQLMGASENQINTVSFGEERPAVDGSNDEAYSLNRRVELVY
jgi:peptidoglycan-associated lipoprotein